MDVRLEAYRVFCKVVEVGTITGAADALYMTQSAVSQTIRQLEQSLEQKLFTRGAKGVTRTMAGEKLYASASRALTLLSGIEAEFERMRGEIIDELRIGASDTLCRHVLTPMLGDFHARYPEVTLQVTNRTTPATLELLRRGQVELAFINLPVRDEDVCVDPLISVSDCFVAAPALAVGAPLTLEAVCSLPLMLLERSSHTRQQLDSFFALSGLELRPQIELCSYELLVEFARIGLGVAGVVREFVQGDLTGGALVEIPLTQPLPERAVGIAYRREQPLSAAAQAFVQALRAHMDAARAPELQRNR